MSEQAKKEETAIEQVQGKPIGRLYESEAMFERGQRMAMALSQSSLVPKDYQGGGKQQVANVMIALDVAARSQVPVLTVMQNLDVINGKPSWSSKFLIAIINQSGKFTPLRFRLDGKEGTDDWGCRAMAADMESDQECVGTRITIGMAKSEGWYNRNGSKWKTFPEQMLKYRAASFWAREFAPELALGLYTSDEIIDISGGASQAEADELNAATAPDGEPVAEQDSGWDSDSSELPFTDPDPI